MLRCYGATWSQQITELKNNKSTATTTSHNNGRQNKLVVNTAERLTTNNNDTTSNVSSWLQVSQQSAHNTETQSLPPTQTVNILYSPSASPLTVVKTCITATINTSLSNVYTDHHHNYLHFITLDYKFLHVTKWTRKVTFNKVSL